MIQDRRRIKLCVASRLWSRSGQSSRRQGPGPRSRRASNPRGRRRAARRHGRMRTSRLVRLPDPLRASYGRLISRNGPDFFVERFRKGLPTSIDELEWQSPMLMGLDELGLAQRHGPFHHRGPAQAARCWRERRPGPVRERIWMASRPSCLSRPATCARTIPPSSARLGGS